MNHHHHCLTTHSNPNTRPAPSQNIQLFERGYEKDPAAVAAEAVKAAQKAACDVVLVDTAGRMQDNEPLMRALSKLINVNKPDLVLFVGEALVGNDAVDQLSKFNQRLADLAADPTTKHLIDGIVLTKFDTIDDKARRKRSSEEAKKRDTYIQIPALSPQPSRRAYGSCFVGVLWGLC